MKDCFIDGERIYLRVPNIQQDVIEGNWHTWFNNETITQFLYHGVFPNSLEKQVEIVTGNINRDDMVLLSVIDKQTDKICGIVSLKDIDLINRIAEITIVMDVGNYPKHAPFEAWALITQYGFEKLNLEQITAGHHEGLWKWVNKIEMIGYKLEGYHLNTHYKYGKKSASVRVGINRNTFYELLEQRKGKYLTNDVESLLQRRKQENQCDKLKTLIEKFYENTDVN